jgi:hypothetical protein
MSPSAPNANLGHYRDPLGTVSGGVAKSTVLKQSDYR